MAGAGFAAVELLAAPAARPSVGVDAAEVLAGVLLLAGLHAAFAALGRRLGRRSVVVPVVLWAMVWGPEQARERGMAPAIGWLAPLALGVVGARWPAAAAAGALLGAIPFGVPEPSAARCRTCPDIVLVTVDTVRADAGLIEAAGAAGWSTGTAVAAAPWTPPSLHSLFLGAPVEHHGAGEEEGGGVRGRPPGAVGLASDLEGLGYTTAAFVSNPHLRAEAGFAEGFGAWAHTDRAPAPLLLLRTGRMGLARWLGWRPSARARDADLITAATTWLDATPPGGRFMWVHLMGPHAWPRVGDADRTPDGGQAGAGRHARYAGLVGSVGGALRGLWGHIPPTATVVLTSDHGELLGEEGAWGHGRSLDPILLEVPLAVRGPALAVPAGGARLTGLRAALRSVAEGQARGMPGADGTRLGGVRGAPGARGMWWRGGVLTLPAAAPARRPPGVAPLGASDRAALQALGYLDGTDGEPDP